MEYERIQKVQTGIISPSKLRMMLIGGSHQQRKKDGSKSNSNSSRTSPSKLQDSEFVKNSLLAPQDGDFDEEVPGLEVSSVNLSAIAVPYSSQGNHQSKESLPRENGDMGRVKMPQFSKVEGGNSSMVHPVRTLDDENLDYDSNASSSSFEFHKGDNNRSLHSHMGRSFQRQMPSKWNDAEKWIMNRKNAQASHSKKNGSQSQGNRMPVTSMVRVAPEIFTNDHKLLINRIAETKRVDFCQPMSQTGPEKFSFDPVGTHPISSLADGVNASGTCPQTKDLQEVGHQELSSTSENSTTGIPTIRSVSMRDMGTEMTPVASQEPSRTGTPVGATTPLRSPTSSVPSTPRRGAPASTPVEHGIDDESHLTENGNKQLSEQDLKLKTRREIVALGVQLGKMNIAAWASKDEKEKNSPAKTIDTDELDRMEFGRRAAAWEEAEKSRHTARYKREEIKIQAWESQQKAKLEAEMRRIEAQVEQMRAQAQAKMVKKISLARQRSEEKRAAADAKKNEQAERTAAQAEYIRQTGQIPSSPFICCGWLR